MHVSKLRVCVLRSTEFEMADIITLHELLSRFTKHPSKCVLKRKFLADVACASQVENCVFRMSLNALRSAVATFFLELN